MAKSKPPHLSHLLSMQSLDEEKIIYFLDRADYFLKNIVSKNVVLDILRGKIIANLFFEPSTRTRNSFEIAEKKLGAITLSPDVNQSSTTKGELLIDMFRNLEAMGVELFVIRHPDNNLAQFLATELKTTISVINAGDGSNEHPMQTLTDLMTIRQRFRDLSQLSVAIVGDVKHSRVARSLVIGLKTMRVEDIRIVAPPDFQLSNAKEMQVNTVTDLDTGLQDVDIIYTLRIQKERMPESERPKDQQYFKQFGIK